jgi:cell division protein FtsZ
VNEASTLIQSSAHEDANIIFGAVLDERMGDEVKITVIATGFRDQMPERRARMLDVEEIQVLSVPVLPSDSWMREKAPAAPAVPPPPRFMSEDDDDSNGEEEPELVGAATRSSREETAEESSFVPLPRDYASDFGNGVRPPSITEEPVSQQHVSPLATSSGEEERDLDVPTFMRRMKF